MIVIFLNFTLFTNKTHRLYATIEAYLKGQFNYKYLLFLFSQQSILNAIFYINNRRKMSSSRPKTKQPDVSSFDLLHSGVRRSLNPKEYTKLFTKIRIGQPKIRSFLPFTDRNLQEECQAENTSLREKIKEIVGQNENLNSRISKEHKLERLLEKRINSSDLYALSFEKALQIKLMLEADMLQQNLRDREFLLNATSKEHREREEWSKAYNNMGESQLYVILLDSYSVIADKLREKENNMDIQQEKIIKMKERSRKIRQVKRLNMQQLRQIEREVKKAKESFPNINKISNENDNGIYGTQIRAKTTQNLQIQIQKLQSERITFERKIQHLIQQKVKEKIQILKAINQFQNITLGDRRRLLY